MATESEDLQTETPFPSEEEIQEHADNVPARPSISRSDVPLLAWNSIIKVVADAEPIHAAGVAGLLVIFILSIFGRIGSLIVGVLAGLLLHASLERRRDNVRLHDLTDKLAVPRSAAQREVLVLMYSECLIPGTSRRYNTPKDKFGASLFLGSRGPRLRRLVVQSSFCRHRIPLSISTITRITSQFLCSTRTIKSPGRNGHVGHHVCI